MGALLSLSPLSHKSDIDFGISNITSLVGGCSLLERGHCELTGNFLACYMWTSVWLSCFLAKSVCPVSRLIGRSNCTSDVDGVGIQACQNCWNWSGEGESPAEHPLPRRCASGARSGSTPPSGAPSASVHRDLSHIRITSQKHVN